MDKSVVAAVNKLLVRENGVVNPSASLTHIHNVMNHIIEMENEQTQQVGFSVEQYWAENPQKDNLKIEALASAVFAKLGYDDSLFNETTALIKRYVRQMNDIYYVARGANGGVRRWDRMSEEEQFKARASLAKAELKRSEKQVEKQLEKAA